MPTRQNIYSLVSVLILIFIGSSDLSATHNRSGEITYQQIGPLTIRATITTYTKASSTSADRDTLTLNWGDGTSELVGRSNGNGDLIPGEDIKVNFYTAEHTYPGRASYTLSFEDPNRVNNIVNVNFPNSVDVPFFVSTTFTLINTQFQGFNNSVVLLQPPIDFACANKRFVHNPNAYDIDGDSLSYELVTPLQAENEVVPAYQFPDQVSAGPDNQIFLDPVTGDFIWDSPKQTGEYNIAIKINEYRNGILLNSVIRDMQIRVQTCQSTAPELEVEEEICVVAGERIEIPVVVTDEDQNEMVQVSATGGPFLVPYSSAILTGSDDFGDSPLTRMFVWETKCEHISNTNYQVVFRAQDNSINGTSGLSVLKTLTIKVVGPPPENLIAEAQDETIKLSWDLPYACEETLNDYFIGFSVWRKENTQFFDVDSCTPGLEGMGYQIINFLTNENDGSRYHYTDTDVEKSKIYCYRVVAQFAQKTVSGNPFNLVESLSSNEACLQLNQDIPLLTEVSVSNTDENTGDISVQWIKPKLNDFDTLENPGPYRYELLRSQDGIIFDAIAGAVFESTFFDEDIDLAFLDGNLNTLSNQYYYRVDFYANDMFYSSSPISSSIYLNINSSDNINRLIWEVESSWQNFNYRIFRKDDINTSFTEIAETRELSYSDTNVENEMNYCYVVQSFGTYGLENTPEVLINFSQENCGTPIDTVGPCTPALTVSNPCSSSENPEAELQNYLSWTRSNFICEDSRDVASYNIYFSFSDNEVEQLIATVDASENSFEHLPEEGINGCYKISAVDSLGNEGELSDYVCVSNCPIYVLPNTFTPNGDSSNDLFTPRENRFVSSVNFQVFNRWGNKIYETNDPSLNWNGEDFNGRNVDQGTYYYTCDIFDTSNDGLPNLVDRQSGYIQVLR